MGNSVNINVAGIFYEIVNATYIAIIEIVNETFMNFGISKTQINTGFIRRYAGGALLIRAKYSQNLVLRSTAITHHDCQSSSKSRQHQHFDHL